MQSLGRRMVGVLRLADQLGYSSLSATATGFAKNNNPLPPGYRPPSPFALLLKELYRPGMKVAEVGSTAGQQWKGMSDADKQRYIQQAHHIGKQRKAEFESLSEGVKQDILEKAKQRAAKRKKRVRLAKIRKFNAATGRPKRAPTPYILFIKEFFQNRQKVTSLAEANTRVKEAADAWKKLSDSDKEVYQQRAQPAKEKYQLALAEWKEKMEAKKPNNPFRRWRNRKKKGEQIRQRKLLEEASLEHLTLSTPEVKKSKKKKK